MDHTSPPTANIDKDKRDLMDISSAAVEAARSATPTKQMDDKALSQILVDEWNKWTEGPKVFHTGQLVMDWGTGQVEVAIRAMRRIAALQHPGAGNGVTRDEVLEEAATSLDDLVGASESMHEAMAHIRALKSPTPTEDKP